MHATEISSNHTRHDKCRLYAIGACLPRRYHSRKLSILWHYNGGQDERARALDSVKTSHSLPLNHHPPLLSTSRSSRKGSAWSDAARFLHVNDAWYEDDGAVGALLGRTREVPRRLLTELRERLRAVPGMGIRVARDKLHTHDTTHLTSQIGCLPEILERRGGWQKWALACESAHVA